MADGIVWNLAAKALELVAKSAVRESASWWGARDDLQKLENSIRMIQARVRDAERRQEDVGSDAIKEWLRRLRQVLYRADDLFDEVLTLDLLREQESEKTMLCKVGILFTKSASLCYNIKLANEIKAIRKQLDDIKLDMAGLNLSNLPAQELPMARLLENRETSSFVIQEDVTGRENDQNNIINMLLNPKKDGEQITVISIVGFGGLGKTTLAQLVFNDVRVQNHFELTKWAYVPEKNNKIVMMGKVYRSLTNRNYDNLSLEQIQQGIRESIETQRYLLVLDDIWDEGDDIKELLNLLKRGKHGSKVIITTRSDVVAKHFGSIQTAYKLGTLTDDQSWELFKKLAFGPGHEDYNPDLSKIGEDIVKMCKNVPLVIKIIGGSLCSKHTTEEWLQVKNDISKAQLADNNKITAVLKLSYDYLPAKSKLCFAYCSLFPKGYEFDKVDLVHLWMAQGYVELDKGEQYFMDMVARNLFQGPKVILDRDTGIYKMHDLLHNLAQEVAGDEIMMYEHPNRIHDQLVHLNLDGSKRELFLKDVKRLRSLLCISYYFPDKTVYSKLKYLRVLSIGKPPSFVGMLIHLRYLKLKSKAKYLPDSITRLVNLQTLKLESCMELEELPRDFAKLVNLRHLLLPEQLIDMPPGFGKLTSLQDLNFFIVGKGTGIESLTALNLRGELGIIFHSWHRDAVEERKRANLKDNYQLTSLILQERILVEEFTPVVAGEMNEMLRCLQLPPYLKQFVILWYKGEELPVRWFDGLSHLVDINITFCTHCKRLPKMSGLPHLKSLKLCELSELEYVEDEDEDNIRVGTASVAHSRCFFPSLEVLTLFNCFKLKGWRRTSMDEGEQCQLVFHCLLKMQVHGCPMLKSLPLAPKLESVDVCNINWKVVESSIMRSNEEAASSSSTPPSSSNLLTSLKKLAISVVKDELMTLSIGSAVRIGCCSELRNLRFESPYSIRELIINFCWRLKSISEGFQHLSGLEKLEISWCDDLGLEEEGKSGRGWQGLSNLRELKLYNVPKVKTLPRGIAYLTTLQQLHLEFMDNLTELPEDIGNLSLLRHLYINVCPKVKSLPSSILCLPMLQELTIRSMENLTDLTSEIGKCNLPLLHHLHIKYCPKMTSFPTSVLASLQTLTVIGSPDLAEKFMPNGEYCHLIQHIPHLEINDGSQVYRRRDGKEEE